MARVWLLQFIQIRGSRILCLVSAQKPCRRLIDVLVQACQSSQSGGIPDCYGMFETSSWLLAMLNGRDQIWFLGTRAQVWSSQDVYLACFKYQQPSACPFSAAIWHWSRLPSIELLAVISQTRCLSKYCGIVRDLVESRTSDSRKN